MSSEILDKYKNYTIPELQAEIIRLKSFNYKYKSNQLPINKVGDFKKERYDFVNSIIDYLQKRLEDIRNDKLNYLLEYKSFINSFK